MTPSVACRLTFLVIGPASFLDEVTRGAWHRSGVELIGPMTAEELQHTPLNCSLDGAVIDVCYEADVLLAAIELFDNHKINAVFACPASLAQSLTGGFVLSQKPDDMTAIIEHLTAQKNLTLH
jgi:hypothetical protein